MKLGFTLPNRGVLFGATTAAEMLDMAEIADRVGPFQSVWVGDSLFGKPRMESIALLAASPAAPSASASARPAWPAFPLRDPVQLAYQWASLDLLAEGRTCWWPAPASSSRAGIRSKRRPTTSPTRIASSA